MSVVHRSYDSLLIQNRSVNRDCSHLPRNEFAALLQCFLGCHLESTAARHFHPHDGDGFDVIVLDDLCELLGVIHSV